MRALILIATLVVSSMAFGHDFYRGYAFGPYGYPWGDPFFISPRAEFELSRIRDELRVQRRQAATRDRHREAEISVLLGQANASHQVSAAQACYYRTVGAMELCEDLFEAGTTDYTRCEALVQARNPGCSLTR